MVMEYLVGKVPFSDHIPVVNRFSPKKQRDDADNDTSTTPIYVTAGSGSGSGSDEGDFEEYSESDEIKPIEIPSPKNKIHNKLIEKRNINANSSTTETSSTLIVDDGNIFDTPTKKKSHLFVDNSSSLTVSQRLARRRSKRATEQGSPVSSSKYRTSSRTSEGSSGSTGSMESYVSTGGEQNEKEEDESADEREQKIQRYLNDQNNKFDELISKNIDVVLCPNSTKTPNEKLIKMVYDNRKSLLGTLYQLGKAEALSRLPYIPIINPKNNPDTQRLQVINGSKETTPTLLGSPFTDYCQQVIEYDGNEPYVEEPDSAQGQIDQERLDELMAHLDNEIKVDIFIDTLDDRTKVMLYKLLKSDLKDYHQEGEFKNIYHSKNVSPLDKLQMFVVISVKLAFAGLKLFLPITKYLLHKFKENELFIFNRKNMERLIDLVLSFMNFLDAKLSNNEELLEKMYQQDYVKADQVYQEFTSNTADFFKPSSIKNMLFSEDDVVANGIYDLVVGRITRKDKSSYLEDPQYAKYYSRRRKMASSKENGDEEGKSEDEDEDEGDDGDDIRLRSTGIAASSSGSSYTSGNGSGNASASGSSSSGGNPSILKAAEKFFNEM